MSNPDRLDDDQGREVADPDWFREPNPRERRIAAALFAGFGVFFVMLFLLHRGWWFRWVIFGLGLISLLNALRHLRSTRHPQQQ